MRFRVGVTFTGTYRNEVRQIVEALLKIGFAKEEIFFDEWHDVLINGPNADIKLQDIYTHQCNFVVVFLSKDYGLKKWTGGVEWRAIRDIINSIHGKKICLLNIDDADINEIVGLTSSVDIAKKIDKLSPNEVAEFIRDFIIEYIREHIRLQDDTGIVTDTDKELIQLLNKLTKTIIKTPEEMQRIILEKLRPYIRTSDNERFNYERYLCFDKARYLDAFINKRRVPPFELEIQMSSECNLKCRWCIGAKVQSSKRVLNLPNMLNEENIGRVVKGILEMNKDGLSIEAVKFSGFIGEPLFEKEATKAAIRMLAGAGKKVGLFTNGVDLTEDTWDTVLNIDYVHISLDAGPESFGHLKESDKLFSRGTFKTVMENLEGLCKYRDENNGKVKINVGYIIVPGNEYEIYKTARMVKEAGADMIRFKCDIAGQHNLIKEGTLDDVFSEIKRVEDEFHDRSNNPPKFAVYSIHSRQEIESESYASWRCDKGCHYQYFATTLGSDGNLYLCDHNTMPGAIPIGNIIDNPFKDVWHNDRHKYLAEGVKYLCLSSVCPPFGNRVNAFLDEIVQLRKEYGASEVIKALKELRQEYSVPAGTTDYENLR